MEVNYCQSCGMPMGNSDDLYGTEPGGNKSPDFCSYCYKDGNFTFQGTMDEMIEICVPHMVQGNKEMTEEVARGMMRMFFPTLKRWKEKQGSAV